MAVGELQRKRRTVLDARSFRYHDLDEPEIGVLEIPLLSGGPVVLESELADQLVDGFRSGLDHENIVGLDNGTPGHARKARATAHQTDDGAVGFLRILVQLTDALSGHRAALGDVHFGDVILQVEELFARIVLRAIGRNEPPADEHDEEQADDGAHSANRRKIEHPVGFAQRLEAICRDDDVRRGADEGHHAAENGCEGQRHERQRGAALGVRSRLHIHRHQQRKRRDIVHHRGQCRAHSGKHADVGADAARGIDHVAGNQLDGTGVRKPPADDQHQGDDDGGGVTEAGECLLAGDHAGNQCHQQRTEGDDVVPPAAPDEKREHEAEQREQNDLILGHTARALSGHALLHHR